MLTVKLGKLIDCKEGMLEYGKLNFKSNYVLQVITFLKESHGKIQDYFEAHNLKIASYNYKDDKGIVRVSEENMTEFLQYLTELRDQDCIFPTFEKVKFADIQSLNPELKPIVLVDLKDMLWEE